jgi:hypothetical protein
MEFPRVSLTYHKSATGNQLGITFREQILDLKVSITSPVARNLLTSDDPAVPSQWSGVAVRQQKVESTIGAVFKRISLCQRKLA